MPTIRVLIADDNAPYRSGLKQLLQSMDDFQVVGEAHDGKDAVAQTLAAAPDIVLMDIAMPRMSGLEATRALREQAPTIPVVMLTASDEDQDLYTAVTLGARGYIKKNETIDEIVETLHMVVEGGARVSPSLVKRLLAEFVHLGGGRPRVSQEDVHLTPREQEILSLLAQGQTNTDIAAALFIAPNTVKVHLRNILDKLQVKNRQQAAVLAVQEGWVT
jgi:DNA-binding NarL/FixJ family response regulator